MLKGVDLIDHTSIFLLHTINHWVILKLCTLSFKSEPHQRKESTSVSLELKYTNKVFRCSTGQQIISDLIIGLQRSEPFEPKIPTRSSDTLLGYRVFRIAV